MNLLTAMYTAGTVFIEHCYLFWRKFDFIFVRLINVFYANISNACVMELTLRDKPL
jgi:hypothetical protein